MIKQTNGYISISNEDDKRYYSLFEPEVSVKATLLILHGMQEHSQRYQPFAEYFADNGIAVLTYDHAGHGKSVKTKDDLGFFVKKNPAQKVVNDAIFMADFLEEKYTEAPHFLLGHSMGSFIARCTLQQSHQKFAGGIIVGTGGKMFGIGLVKSIFSIFNAITPRKRTKFNQLFNSFNNARFRKDVDNDGTNWLSLNPENRKAFVADELCGLDFTNNGFFTLFSLYAKATNKHWSGTIPKSYPILFVSGQNDPIGNFGKGVIQTFNDLQKDGFQNIKMKLYPEMRHEIHNEEQNHLVYDDIRSWIGEIIK